VENVIAHRLPRAVGISCDKRIDDRSVLDRVQFEPIPLILERTPDVILGCGMPYVRYRFLEEFALACGVYDGVKAVVVEAHVLVVAGLNCIVQSFVRVSKLLGGGFEIFLDGLKPPNGLGRNSSRSQLACVALKRSPHMGDLDNMAWRRSPNRRGSVRREVDQSMRLKSTQCLANWRATYSESLA
jgi:hypothetical protein